MGTPHKHAELIKAWADGAEIQFYSKTQGRWEKANRNPEWFEDFEYRIKPEEKKPVVRWLWAWHNLQVWSTTEFYTKKEMAEKGFDLSRAICLEWSRTEFPE